MAPPFRVGPFLLRSVVRIWEEVRSTDGSSRLRPFTLGDRRTICELASALVCANKKSSEIIRSFSKRIEISFAALTPYIISLKGRTSSTRSQSKLIDSSNFVLFMTNHSSRMPCQPHPFGWGFLVREYPPTQMLLHLVQ